MGFFSSLVKGAGKLLRSPVGKLATSVIPGAATAYAAYDMASTAADVFGGGNKPAGLPALPGGNLPMPASAALPGMPGANPNMGKRSIFKDDPNVIAALKPYAISMGNLRTYYRAPKGFVIVHDSNGDPFGLPKNIARAYGLWKPSAKPPISATDWKNLKKSITVSKKIKKISADVDRHLTKKSSPRRSIPANYTIVESGKGSVNVRGRK